MKAIKHRQDDPCNIFLFMIIVSNFCSVIVILMGILGLDVRHIIKPEALNKESYRFITTIKYEQEIAKASSNLRPTLGLDYFSMCLVLPNGRKQIISNNPGNIAIPYQINGLHRLDNVFELSSHANISKDFFVAAQLKHDDDYSKLYERIMNEQFNVYNAFGFNRQFDGYRLTMIFARPQQRPVHLLTPLAEKNMMVFTDEFFNQILPCYLIENKDLKYSRFGQDPAFRKNFIYGKYTRSVPELKPRERECLFWARSGKSSAEIANILGLKRPTIKHYLESVREKFQVSTMQEAITLALLNRIIS